MAYSEEDYNEVVPLAQVPSTTWPVGLAVEIADLETSVGAPLTTVQEICKRFDITEEFLESLRGLRAFRSEVRTAIAELKKSNSTVRRKAALQTELYIDTLCPKWLNDPSFPPAEKLKTLMFLAKLGKLVDDPASKNEPTSGAPVAPTLTIILTQPQQVETKVISQDSVTINQ